MGLFLNKVSPVFNENSCHSRSSGIFPSPSLEKRGRGDFMENRFIQKSPSIPLCQRGKIKEGFRTSRNDNKGKTVCKGIGSIYWKPKVLNNKDRWTDF